MKKYRGYILATFLVLTLLFILYLNKGSSNRPFSGINIPQIELKSRQEESLPVSNKEKEVEFSKEKKAIAAVVDMYETPIDFWGKVIDQSGNAVSQARVGYSMADKFMASGSSAHKFSDGNGYFEIHGVKGATLGVKVSKEGYYLIPNVSYQSFAYGLGPDDYNREPPSKDNPAIFRLQKMGVTVPLIKISRKQFDTPPTSGEITIDLLTGGWGEKGLQISSSMGAVEKNRFDWSYKLKITGGGIQERKGLFDFEAPETHYESEISIEMKASDPSWRFSAEKHYFARDSEGRYARISITFYPRDYRNMIVLESYINPIPGDRNLEYDSEKAIKSNL